MIKKILINILLILSFILIPNFVFANDIKIINKNDGREVENDVFDEMGNEGFFASDTIGEEGVQNFMLNIARDLRVIVFAFVMLIGIIMVIKLIFASNTEEEQKKLKLGILWCTIGIIVMQTAFAIYSVLFDIKPDKDLARDFVDKIIQPFINMLMFLASFIFIAMGIYAFYVIVIAGGEEEKIKKGKTIIFQAVLGFIVIKLAKVLVENTYNPDCNGGNIITYGGTKVCGKITENAKIITTLLTWFNTFIALIIVVMIIYAGFLVFTGGGEEEKNKKARDIIFYAFIGVLVLAASYLIMTFFINGTF